MPRPVMAEPPNPTLDFVVLAALAALPCRQRRALPVGPHLFHDPDLANAAAVAAAVHAVMARYVGESLRAEAARRGVSVFRVRRERYERLGFTPTQAGGHRGGVSRLTHVELGGPNGPLPQGLRLRGPADRARYYSLVKDLHDLAEGPLRPADFDATWKGRRLGGQTLPGSAELLEDMNTGDFDPRRVGTP
jgi:hypothetical protein